LTIDTFLSHADEDKKMARKFADRLSPYGFDVFVAHDDIKIGETWEDTLKEKIKNCELFIALLSVNFRKARFTDHEIGIATALNKQIFPVSLDETKPYGFMSKFQSKGISPHIDPFEIQNLAESLARFTDEGKDIIDNLIGRLESVESFNNANYVAELLFEYTNFTHPQINRIAEAFLSNDQIQGGWTAKPSCLEFLAKNWEYVKEEHKFRLQKWFRSL